MLGEPVFAGLWAQSRFSFCCSIFLLEPIIQCDAGFTFCFIEIADQAVRMFVLLEAEITTKHILRGESLHELQRRHHDVGRAIPVGALQLQHHLPGAIALEPFISDCRARDVAAQVFEFFALISAAAHRRVQTEAVHVGEQRGHGWLVCTGQAAQAENLLSRAWAERDAISARNGVGFRSSTLPTRWRLASQRDSC